MKWTAVCVAGMLATLADGARIDGQYLFLSKEWTPQKQAEWEDAHIKDAYIVTNQAEIRIPAPSIDPTIANKEALFPVHTQTVCDEVVEYKYTQVKYTVSARKRTTIFVRMVLLEPSSASVLRTLCPPCVVH